MIEIKLSTIVTAEEKLMILGYKNVAVSGCEDEVVETWSDDDRIVRLSSKGLMESSGWIPAADVTVFLERIKEMQEELK